MKFLQFISSEVAVIQALKISLSFPTTRYLNLHYPISYWMMTWLHLCEVSWVLRQHSRSRYVIEIYIVFCLFYSKLGSIISGYQAYTIKANTIKISLEQNSFKESDIQIIFLNGIRLEELPSGESQGWVIFSVFPNFYLNW